MKYIRKYNEASEESNSSIISKSDLDLHFYDLMEDYNGESNLGQLGYNGYFYNMRFNITSNVNKTRSTRSYDISELEEFILFQKLKLNLMEDFNVSMKRLKDEYLSNEFSIDFNIEEESIGTLGYKFEASIFVLQSNDAMIHIRKSI